mmetsp:Transcript_37471/g.91083  ORF Transcript_37471/g.91083 Transcript_37471/m.91083 type:complete len:294 (+) Transcript_37471:497-1378(+)
MALVNVVNMVVLDNPTCFTNPFQFEITFECLQELDDDLEWKVLYVGSAQDSSRDQILDEILVGPVPVGINKFVLQADAPDPTKLSQEDLLGVTVVLVTCSYKEREFVRVGYYVNNEYHDPNAPPAPPPLPTTVPAAAPTSTAGGEEAGSEQQQQHAAEQPQQPAVPNPVPLEHIQRQILADKPRVTKFPISWGDEAVDPQQQQQQDQSMAMMDDDDDLVIDNSNNHNHTSSAPTTAGGVGGGVGGNVVSPPSNIGPGGGAMVGPSGVVDMQEESNLSHGSHFAGSNTAMTMNE